MNFDEMLEQECEENFWDIVNYVSSYLMKNNEKYKKYTNKCCDIINNSHNLQEVIENEVPIDLTKEEVSNLIAYISNSSEKNTLEKQQLIYAGSRITYFLLKKLDLLK